VVTAPEAFLSVTQWMMTMLYLSDAEIADLCAPLTQPAAQVRYLRALGLTVEWRGRWRRTHQQRAAECRAAESTESGQLDHPAATRAKPWEDEERTTH
jgi:hypothetical protein